MKQRKTILCSTFSVLLMTLTLVTFSAGQVFAAIFFVTENGSGSGVSISDSLGSIQQAIDAAVYGDEVLVSPGTYTEQITMKSGVNVSGTSPLVTFIRWDVITGGTTDPIVDFNVIQNATLKNFTIAPVTPEIKISDHAVSFINADSTAVLLNCIIYGTQYGIYVGGGAPTIENNTLFGGVLSYSDWPGTSLPTASEQGIQLYSGAAPIIRNNIVTGYDFAGIHVDDGAPQVFAYNDVWGNLTDSEAPCDYVGLTDQTGSNGNISADPLFLDPDTLDFSLGYGSPCIDATFSVSPFDADGTARDIGIYPLTPVAYYSFSDGILYDESGYGNDPDFLSGVFTTDRFGTLDNAYHFDGTTYIRVPDDPSLHGEEFSFHLWVKPEVAENFTLLSKYSLSNGYFVQSYDSAASPKYWSFYVSGKPLSSISSVMTGQWTHLAGTYDGSTMKIYINGSLEVSTTTWGVNSASVPLYIGANSPGTFNNFTGDIDEIALYNYALSEYEIQSMIDMDGDGYSLAIDCEDSNSSVNAGQSEITGNGIDDDCNPATSDFGDADGDGYASDVDCEDLSAGADGVTGTADDGANIYPGAPETPDDGIDQDCNGIDARTCYVDSDWDNHGTTSTVVALDGLCDMDQSESNLNDDCDDTDPTVYRGAEEICDGKDNDCGGIIDNIISEVTNDFDADGYEDCEDNCPEISDDTQADNDGDYIGDACDGDIDNDFIGNLYDTCPFSFDPSDLDSDDDGIGNVCDNCPDDSNNDQLDENNNGIGDVCETVDDLGLLAPKIKDTETTEETDTDSDGIFDSADNCPNIANDDQSDFDEDGSGDVCDDDDDNDLISDSDETSCGSDPLDDLSTCEVCDGDDNDLDGDYDEGFDLDGDNYTICQNDCNDNDFYINPGMSETCNGKDDDCDSTTLDCGYAIIVKEIAYTKDGNLNTLSYEEWLPEAGLTYEIEFQVIGTSGPLDPQPTITLAEKAGSINHLPGAYTNDPCADQANDCFDDVTPDIVFTDIGNNKVQVKSNDYAGSVIITAQITDPDVIVKDIEFPKDADDNGLPDGWESQYNVSLGSGSDDFDNDGLTNFEEYRGVIWGPELVRVEADPPDTAPDPNTPYHFQTAAYMPKTGSGNDLFRPDPTKKDLFVKYTGYDVATYDGTAYTMVNTAQCTGLCPFAIGEAFKLAGVDVHAVSLSDSPSEYNIQSLTVTNNLTEGYYNIYNTFKVDLRSWNIATFGFSGVGTTDPETGLFTYGSGTRTYNKAITAYFKDKPYKDENPEVYPSNADMLDPPTGVEDANDNAQNDKIGKDYEAGCADCSLDGDILGLPLTNKDAEGFIAYDLSTMDIDNDGRVELPRILDPTLISASEADSNGSTDEFTFEQVLKHTLTHEIGHSVGMNHNSNSDCLMYEISVDWSRDNHFSSTAIEQMTIRNQ